MLIIIWSKSLQYHNNINIFSRTIWYCADFEDNLNWNSERNKTSIIQLSVDVDAQICYDTVQYQSMVAETSKTVWVCCLGKNMLQ